MAPQKKEKSDINSNMRPMVTLNHPFLNGCRNLPLDRKDELQQIKIWTQTQPHLPPLKGKEWQGCKWHVKHSEELEHHNTELEIPMLKELHRLQNGAKYETRKTYEHLYLFLHSNYYNLEATKDTIEAYYQLRSSSPELFSNRALKNPPNELAWTIANMIAVPKTTPEGYNVLIYRLADSDISKLQFVDAMKAFFLFNDIRLSEDGLSPGYIVIFDMKGVCFSHLAKINLSAVRKFMNYIQEGHPARLKGVHVINAVAFMDKILGIVRPLMKTGLVKLLTIHGSNLTNLFKIVPQEILPDDYGGQADSVQTLHDQHRKLVEGKYEKWIEEEEFYVIDECKRPKPTAKKECFVSSSFRSLQID